MRHGAIGRRAICQGISRRLALGGGGGDLVTFVAFLHSIVLTEERRVIMSDLRRLALDLGFENPQTLASTGNLVIDCRQPLPVAEAERRLEAGIEQAFGKHIDVIVRTSRDFKRLAAVNPYPGQSAQNGGHVCVRVQREAMTEEKLAALEKWKGEGDLVTLVEPDLWIAFGGKPSQSRLLSRLTIRHLGIGTTRNWNTIQGLAKILATRDLLYDAGKTA